MEPPQFDRNLVPQILEDLGFVYGKELLGVQGPGFVSGAQGFADKQTNSV